MSEKDPFTPIESHLNAQPDRVDYELLTGHYRTDNSFKTDEQLRTEYISLTDELVRKMTDGVEIVDPVTGEIEVKKPDFVIWLDKSARPVSWLTKELWPLLAANEDGNVPKIPEFRYLNIDREQWVNTIDPYGIGAVDIDLVDKSIIRSLRSVFMPIKELKEGLTDEIDNKPTELDGKTVLIVDEVYASGRTLLIAEEFIKRAFPNTNVAATHWMKGIAVKNGAVGNADLPVWYNEFDHTGRGVGNRNERVSSKSHSTTQRLGAWFLSTVVPGGDPKSKKLRQELSQLANDAKNHEVLVIPSHYRDVEDFDKRALRYNGLENMKQFIARKRKIDSTSKQKR